MVFPSQGIPKKLFRLTYQMPGSYSTHSSGSAFPEEAEPLRQIVGNARSPVPGGIWSHRWHPDHPTAAECCHRSPVLFALGKDPLGENNINTIREQTIINDWKWLVFLLFFMVAKCKTGICEDISAGDDNGEMPYRKRLGQPPFMNVETGHQSFDWGCIT